MQYTILAHPGPGRVKPHLLGSAAIAVDPGAAGAARKPVKPVKPAPVASTAGAFWDALAAARAAHNRSHDCPLPWAATPSKARRVRFINQHGELATVKQPAQFQCPPARFWPNGHIPFGVVAPPAMVDETDAQYLARMERRHAANVGNLQRWHEAYGPDGAEYADWSGIDRAEARATLAGAPPMSHETLAVLARLRAACRLSAGDVEQARRNLWNARQAA